MELTAEDFLKDKTNYSGIKKFATVTEGDIIVWLEQYAQERVKAVKQDLITFYEVGEVTGYSNAELSRIQSCINKISKHITF